MHILSSTIAILACAACLLAGPGAFAEDGPKPAPPLQQLPKIFSGKQARNIQPPAEEPWPSTLWKPIRLSPGVVPGGPRHSGMPSDRPRCRRIGDVVYLEGTARAAIGAEQHASLGFLPTECMRRAPWEEISFDIPSTYQNAIFDVIIRQAAINVHVRRSETPVTTMSISLYGISYPVE